MRSLLLIMSLLLAWPAWPARADTRPDAPPSGMVVLVELLVNGKTHGPIVELTVAGDRLWLDRSSLREAGMVMPGDGIIDLASQADMRPAYDAARQTLLLDVDAHHLPLTRISGAAAQRVPTQVDPGLLINYDAYLQRVGGRSTASLWSEQRGFTALASLSNTGIVRAGGAQPAGYVRYDTSLRAFDSTHAVAFVAGDLITQSLPWSRSVRLGGLSIARNFSIRPDLITTPLPSFAGQAALPSAVDLFVNGYRQQRIDVEPGRFVLDQMPLITGAGEARIVTTDAVGRQVETLTPFYVAPTLLQPGLIDFAVELGAIRQRYGLASFAYGRTALSASLRRGMTEHITLEAHAEGSRGLAQGGVGAVWAPGLWGAVHGSASVSGRSGETGHQWTLGYAYQGPRFSLAAEHVERSHAFADLGSIGQPNWRGASSGDRVHGSLLLSGIGSMGIGYISSRTRDGSRARIASGSLSMPIRDNLSFFAAADHEFGSGNSSVQLRLVASFGRSAGSAGLARQVGGRWRADASLSRTASPHGGIGYAVDGAIDDAGQMVGQVSTVWRGPFVQATLGASRAPARTALWAGATGAIAFMDNHLFAANSLPDAFALIATGMPDVPVSYENQPMGRTDASGRLFVPNVTAFHPGRFAIDLLNLPVGAEAHQVDMRAALRPGTGAVLRMPVTLQQSAIIHLVDRRGQPIAVGAVATLGDGQQQVVGWDGILHIRADGVAVIIDVSSEAGSCTASLSMPSGLQPYDDLGRVPCV